MEKTIKHQLIYAIDKNFRAGQDKHSLKRQGYEKKSTIFSFQDRKNLLDTAAAFANWLQGQKDAPKALYDIQPQHIQKYLIAQSAKWTQATFTVRLSQLRKLEKLAQRTYPKSKISFMDGVTAPKAVSAPKRTVQISETDFKRLLDYASLSRSAARYAPFLAGVCGLRASECAKLQSRDILIFPDSAAVYIADSKGRRSRTVMVQNPAAVAVLVDIKASTTGRVCPAKSESLNAFLRRSFQALDMGEYIHHKTGYHALRKRAAQKHFDRERANGMSIKDALNATSRFLGHGNGRDALMRHYVLNIH